jgi:V8-like Glu-specific endopeptidase
MTRHPIGALALLALLVATAARAADSELDRRQAANAPDPAMAAIGLLTGTATRCTAFLMGSDRTVVTAAHCVLDRDGRPAQDRFAFQPGYHDGKGAQSVGARVVVAGNWRPNGDGAVAEDWAILLADASTGITPLDYAADVTPPQLSDRALAAIGYSVDVATGRFVTEDAPCRATRIVGFRIHHGCRGALGAAGSPIFALDALGGRGPLVGVVTQGAASSTSERLAIAGLMRLAPMRGIPEIDYGGRAVFVGAFVNAAKLTAGATAMK